VPPPLTYGKCLQAALNTISDRGPNT